MRLPRQTTPRNDRQRRIAASQKALLATTDSVGLPRQTTPRNDERRWIAALTLFARNDKRRRFGLTKEHENA